MASLCRTRIFRRVKQNGLAADARVNSRLKKAAHLRAEGAFRPRLPRYVVLLRGQLSAPFRVGLDDLAIRGGAAVLR